jgi:hypothetical protein
MKTIFIWLLFFLSIAPVAYADIYKYVDDNGIVCYTDLPLGKKADRIHKEKTSPAPEQNLNPRRNSKDSGDYHSIVHEKASNYNIDPSLIKAVIKTESNWNDRAVSKKGAIGLMQLMPSTANDMRVRNPFDPEENIEGGTKYLKYLIERFNGDITLALAAYNAGPKTVEKFGYVPPINETKQYVNRVLALYNGQTYYPSASSGDSAKSEKKSQPIYKIVLADGSVLFTNSSFVAKNPAGN